MGKALGPLRSRSFGGVLRMLGCLLDPAEREAVLGDLAEEHATGARAVRAVSGLVVRRLALRMFAAALPAPARAVSVAVEVNDAETWPEWLIPLAVGLIAATAVVALLVPSHGNTLSWASLVSRSAFLLGMAAFAAIAGILLVHRVYREYFRQPGSALLACAWSTAIWLPLLLLVWLQHAIWVVLAPVPIAGLLASFAKRKQARTPGEVDVPQVPTQLFEAAIQLDVPRPANIAVAIASLAEAAVIAACIGDLPLTASLVILITACLAWVFTPTHSLTPSRSAAPARARIAVLPCFLLTCLALTPFLQSGLGSLRLSSVILANPLHSASKPVTPQARAYSSVVLMAPPLPKRTLVVMPPRSMFRGVLRPARPLTIPFDGTYWYFQSPNVRPKTDGKVERGDPTKAHVHSSDNTPLQMEAHQRLGALLDASCCRSLSVSLVNADTRLGVIEVEARLRRQTRESSESVSLGLVPIRSSTLNRISTERPGVHETLQFPIRGKAVSFPFNEITLVFKLAHGRELAGARVQVSSFTLQP